MDQVQKISNTQMFCTTISTPYNKPAICLQIRTSLTLMEPKRSSEKSDIFCGTIRRHIAENIILHVLGYRTCKVAPVLN
jgi:hypothetical protein